jgi:hypothetical protein
MLKTILPGISLFLCFCSLKAQNNLDLYRKKAFTITGALLAGNQIAVQPGFQMPLCQGYALVTEIAIPVTPKPADNFDKITLLRVNAEVKKYPARAFPGRFIALQLSYSYRKFVDNDSGSYSSKGSFYTTYSSAKALSPVFALNFKIGREFISWGNVFGDFFMAAGIRVIATRYHPKDGLQHISTGERRNCTPIITDPAWMESRNYIRPGASIGFRFGWRY